MAKSSQMFASVKSYSQKGKLLSRSDLQTLAESRDSEELITRIKNTPYAQAVAGIQKPYTAEGIEAVLGAHYAELCRMMERSSGDKAVLGAYYNRLIAWNLKIILKAKALKKPQEEIESRLNMRAAELVRERDVLVNALSASSLEEAVASLKGSRFGSEIARAAEIYAASGNIQVIDTYFDKIVYEALARASRTVRDSKLIIADVDAYNLLAVLRGKLWGLDEAAILDMTALSTPSAPRSLLERMAGAATVRDALSELASTRYASLVPQTESDLDAVAQLERALETAIYDMANHAFTRMFSFSTIVAITKLVGYEVRNIASIAYAVEQGIPAETTMSKIIGGTQDIG